MVEKSKGDDILANKKFLENIFNSIMSDPLISIKKTLEKSVETYNKQFNAPTDPPIVLKSLINDFKDGKGRNALHFASSRGDKDIFKYLIDNGGDIILRDDEDNTPLFIATQHSNLELIKYIIDDLKDDITTKRQNGVSVLHLAASVGFIDMINYFLEKGCLLEGQSDLGTPLDWAIIYNHINAIKLLVCRGANLLGGSKFNKQLPPPIIMAINLHYNDIAIYLIDSSYEVIWHQDKENWSILHVASEVGNSVIIEKIINAIDKNEGQAKITQFCDYAINETTALDLAYQNEKWECVCILRMWTTKALENAYYDLKEKQAEPQIKERNIEKANEKKQEGNKLFIAGNYAEALDKYSEAIDYDDQNAILYSNKAGCYIQLKDYQNALKFSQIAKKIDPKWAKAYFREGEAYLNLNEYGNAAASFWEGLNLEPTNNGFREAFNHAVKCGKAYYKKK